MSSKMVDQDQSGARALLEKGNNVIRNEANPNHKLLNYVGVLFDSNLKSLDS